MKLKNHSSRLLICGVAAALSFIAVPAAAEQDGPRLTVAFISDAAQGSKISKEQYDRAISKLEDDPRTGLLGFYAANNLCVSYLKIGDAENAQIACDTAVERIEGLIDQTPTSASRYPFGNEYERLLAVALSNRGVINYINDKPEQARDDFESAIEINSATREAQVNLERLEELASKTA